MIKIIFEATALLIGIMILTSTITLATTITSPNQKTNEDIEDRMPPQYFILLFGKCEKITLNNQTDAYGRLKGDLLIYNKHVFHSPCSQFLIMGNAQYMIEHE